MPRRTTRTKTQGLGKSLENDKKRQAEEFKATRATGVAEGQQSKSVLEQNSLNDFIACAELAQANFEALRGHAVELEQPKILINKAAAVASAEEEERARSIVVPIPWRPRWTEDMGAEELAAKEAESFLEWRRGLARLEEDEGVVMTPYERNLEFWRQLWRCVDRSDLLVQILDVRDPEFYRCKDLERYVRQFPEKRHLILLNKSDFVPADLRRQWAEYFRGLGVDFLFFSALRELHRLQLQQLPRSGEQQELNESDDSADDAGADTALPAHGPLNIQEQDVVTTTQLIEELRSRLPESIRAAGQDGESQRRGVIGFVGYANVGKSSVINSLFGAKKASMSRTPGKTKHLQTLELPDAGLTLCDCPGLVFPSVVATKAHLVINGTYPLSELRDFLAPIRLIYQKVGHKIICEKYRVSPEMFKEASRRRGEDTRLDSGDQARDFLAGYALARQHFLRLGVPDETWAAQRLLRDYCSGALLYCERPPGAAAGPTRRSAADAAVSREQEGTEKTSATPAGAADAAHSEGSDFSDLDEFLAKGTRERRMTKRKERHLNKRMMKGGYPSSVGGPVIAAPHGSSYSK